MGFPIIFATDANYLVPTYVAINSLLRHINKNTDIDIFILHSGLHDKDINHFYKLSNKIHFLTVTAQHLNLSKELSYISIATYYRFFIPELLTNYDKCLYLDSDLVIKGDITPLLQEPIEDYMLMGVRNYLLMEHQPEFTKKRCEECSLENLDFYVNAGVLLMNLKKMRETNLCTKMIQDASINQYYYNDQDILNKHCANQIGLISVKYNFMVQYLKYKSVASDVLHENISDVSLNPTIIHYPTIRKPWKYWGYLMADKWFEETEHIESTFFKQYILKPFVCTNRKTFSKIEKTKDFIRFVLRKYILKDFIATTQRKQKKRGVW